MENRDLLYTMYIEKANRIRNGVYGLTQRELAYNSNKIEGSTLTKRHTETLFNEGAIYCEEGESYKPKDIEEMQGHFAMFNYMLDTLSEPLSEELIKEFHRQLKQCVFEDIANGYNIGEYKGRRNFVGDVEPALPSKVPQKMQELLSWYNEQPCTLEVLAKFHIRYEHIHPFQDGNGRTGQILLFRECLKNDITPFVIRDDMRLEYLSTLGALPNEKKLIALFEQASLLYEKMIDGSLMKAPDDWELIQENAKERD